MIPTITITINDEAGYDGLSYILWSRSTSTLLSTHTCDVLSPAAKAA